MGKPETIIESTIEELWSFFKTWDCREESFRSLEGIPFSYVLTNTNLIIIYCEDQFGKYERCSFLKQHFLDVLYIILSSEELLGIKKYADVLRSDGFSKEAISFLLPICQRLAEYHLDRESKYEIKHGASAGKEDYEPADDAYIVDMQEIGAFQESEIPSDDLSQLSLCRNVLFHPRMEAFYRKASFEQRQEIDDVCDAFSIMNEAELATYLQQKHNKRLHGAKSKIDKIYMHNNSGHRLLWCNGSDIDKERYKNSIVLLDYVDDHESQGKIANRCDLGVCFSNAQRAALYVQKSADGNGEGVIPPYTYKHGMLIPNLTNSQKELLLINPPAMLLGGAGTGKTQVSIYLFLQMYKNGKEPVYITYTDQLTSKVLKELVALGIDQKYAYNHVYKLTDFLKKSLPSKDTDKRIIDFEDFVRWKHTHLNKHKHSSLLAIDDWIAWTYIRGVIRGGAIDRGCRIIERDRFALWMQKREGFDRYFSEEMYQLWLLFQKYCNEEKRIDDNDLAWMALDAGGLVHADAVIIDEVQDLTYAQVKTIKHITNSTSIYMCGDINQRINPTIIDLRSVGREFFDETVKSPMHVVTLGNTFRMGEGIIDFVNNLSSIRREYIGIQDSDSESKITTSRGMNDGMWVTSCNAKYIGIKDICEVVKDSSNSIVIVPNQDEKERLLKIDPEMESRVQLVFESKGLEYDNVVLINFITSKTDIFKDILEYKLKRNTYARVLFNMIYVASTRARESLILFEEKCPQSIEEIFFKNVLSKDSVDDLQRFLSLKVDDEGWMIEGQRLEETRDYRSAKLAYKHIKNQYPAKAITRCDAMLKYLELRRLLSMPIDKLIEVINDLITNEDYELAEEIIMENSDSDDGQWLSGLLAVALHKQNKYVSQDILQNAVQYELLGENGFDIEVLTGILKRVIKENQDCVEQMQRGLKGIR